MAIEKYLAIAGLALCIFFVAEIITIFNFMSNPLNDETFLFGPCSLPMTDVGLQLLDFPCSPREESNVRYMRADALTACKTSREVIKCPSTPSLTPNANVF